MIRVSPAFSGRCDLLPVARCAVVGQPGIDRGRYSNGRSAGQSCFGLAKTGCLILLLLIAPSFSTAADDPASAASAQQLFEQLGLRAMLDAFGPRLDGTLQSMLDTHLATPQGRNLSQQQRRDLEALAADLKVVATQTMAELERRLASTLAQTMTHAEVDSLVTLLRTDVGKTLAHKVTVEQQSREQISEYLLSLSVSELAELEAISRDIDVAALTQKVPQFKARAMQAVQEIIAALPAKLQEAQDRSTAEGRR
jgi:hypothetical protein